MSVLQIALLGLAVLLIYSAFTGSNPLDTIRSTISSANHSSNSPTNSKKGTK